MKPSRIDWKTPIGLVLGLGILLASPFLHLDGLSAAGHLALGIFLMATVFWITEPIPIYATSLAVILLQVLLLSDQSLVLDWLQAQHGGTYAVPKYTSFYNTMANPILILFLGGFALAQAAEKYKLDRNLTRILLKPFGSRPALVALGLMTVTGVLSAFMSNTATTAMMITVAVPILAQVPAGDPFRKVVALSIPIGANIGGIATPIGTPPNAVALAALAKEGMHVAFSTWMMMAIPLVVVTMLLSWWGLMRMFKPKLERFEFTMDSSFERSGKAIACYVVFALTVLLWVTETLHGISANVVAFLPVVLFPALGVLDKKDLRGYAWEVLWLVAGGISLGLSLEGTGLAQWLIGLISWDAFGITGLIILFGVVGFAVANLVSHTVSATLLVPIAIALVLPAAGGVAASLVIPIVTIGIIVSYSMVLPISTPPNAIAMATGMIDTKDLAKAGLWVGLVGFVFTTIFGLWIWPLFF